MEALIKDAIVEHLAKNSLIQSSQHGFTAGRSCLTNLLEYMDELTKLADEGLPVDRRQEFVGGVHYLKI